MSAPANAREARLLRRFDMFTTCDAELLAVRPDQAITAQLSDPRTVLTNVMRTVMNGYSDRPALGRRAVEFVTDAAGRTVAQLQPRFDTLTYRETWIRIYALADALAAARRPRCNARFHQCGLCRRGHGTIADRRRRGSATGKCAAGPAAFDSARGRAGGDVQHRPHQ
jgi:hypothetical protein